ncbi:P-loop ATPase, Sll1717 family [Nitrobacter sp.]|jgi:hypothetical protein|uniref:P-loop ATPase, Sll1717 family n=1 Tax=Nitrobacter sp. TaxID=29420 RepID=UPI003F64ECAB
MDAGIKKDSLRKLSFGNQVAEEEREALKGYFVKTQAWDRINNGEIDIIYGPKGAGKSALYFLIQESVSDFFDRRVLLIPAENPQGAPAFRDLETNPPTSEREFIAIWKLYFLSLLGRTFDEYGIDNQFGQELRSALVTHKLLPDKRTGLGSVLASVRRYISIALKPESLETGLKVEPNSGLPTGVTAKIVFREPAIDEHADGYQSIDELLALASSALEAAAYDVWFTIDRLDVAFNDSSELEKNAIRALFRAYRDMRSHTRISLKIFLRTDIWKRVTEEGFSEATHLSRDMHIKWNKQSLQNLILRRLLSNADLVRNFDIDQNEILNSSSKQDELFARLFPEQVELGEKQSTTLDWLLKRTADGSKESQPRDIILFLNKVCEVQSQRLERGEDEPPDDLLFDRASFKEALPALSEYRVSRVLFAEYAELRSYIEALREDKTEQNVASLARRWKTTEEESLRIARKLRDVGFFEERTSAGETTFWVPFVYRPYLAMVQGKVDDINSSD